MSEEVTASPTKKGERFTPEELMVRLKVFIGGILALTLFGIVFVVLYSLIFVTQPLNAISPIDQKFFELIIPLATFLTGTLSGIMLAGGNKEAQMKAIEAATRPVTVSSAPTAPMSSTTSASGNVTLGGNSAASFSYKAPTQAAKPAVPTAPAVQKAPVVLSSSGKPMPLQDPEPEL